jgi:hypothetical protein
MTDDRSDYALYQILYGTQGTSLQMDIYREAVGGIMNMGFMECNTSSWRCIYLNISLCSNPQDFCRSKGGRK